MPERFLIVRTDRLGDVLLTTPLSTALRRKFPDSQITWLVRPYAAPLLDNNPDVDEIMMDTGQSLSTLTDQLRAGQFTTAIISFPRFRTAWATWRAGIPRRIGPASKWYSIFFSDRLTQHRSRGERHEADYNLELLTPLGITPSPMPTRFLLEPSERAAAQRTLEGHRLKLDQPLVILHPGSGGSSPRWPFRHFMELGNRLMEASIQVVVTAGAGETFQSVMMDQMRRLPIMIPAGSVNLRELAAIFSWASLVVSNSTGPLHLAVSLDVPTVSVFSPIPACHPRRWGPYPAYVQGDPKHRVAVAPISTDGVVEMAAVSVDEVWTLCQQQLRGKPGASTS